MAIHIHWLKIPCTANEDNERRQYAEIHSYLDRYPGTTATLHNYDYSLFDKVVRLECHENWQELGLDANTGSHGLRHLSRKPANISAGKPFSIPERLQGTALNERLAKLREFYEAPDTSVTEGTEDQDQVQVSEQPSMDMKL